jgi:hypothetical protein
VDSAAPSRMPWRFTSGFNDPPGSAGNVLLPYSYQIGKTRHINPYIIDKMAVSSSSSSITWAINLTIKVRISTSAISDSISR